MSTVPQADQIEGAPHPRETQRLCGQARAEQDFLEAFYSGRMHHGWLISGPRGVGKATLAWRIARFLLATPLEESGGLFDSPPPAETLDISPDHPVSRRILAGSEPGLCYITRGHNEKTGRLRDMIIAEDVRDLNEFLHLSMSDGGRRVIIIDSADEMNVQAANALLKMLEEPPARTVMLLVSHQPSRLLPTIRSRCRSLRLNALGAEDMAQALDQAGCTVGEATAAVAELAGGSVGEAIRLVNADGLQLYAALTEICGQFPQLNRAQALKLADSMVGAANAARFELLLQLLNLLFLRLARAGATGSAPTQEAVPGEAKVLTALSPDPTRARGWAQTGQDLMARLHHGRSVNLDPAALVLDTMVRMQAQARE